MSNFLIFNVCTSRVMVLPVRVFTKICMVPTFLTSETNRNELCTIGKPKWCTFVLQGNYLAFFLDFAFIFLLAMGSAVAGCPDLEAFKAALALKFLAFVSSAFFLTTAA